MKVHFFKITTFLLILAIVIAGCNKQEQKPKEEFCTCLNVENIDKTIPMVNEWLAGLSNDLTDSQKLNALAAWLKAQPCINDATLRSETNEIIISFDENGVSKSFVLEFTTSPPLKVSGIREYEEPKKDFCFCLDVENIEQTITYIDEFLVDLSNDLTGGQKLDALVTWLKSCTCFTDARVLCQSCIKTDPPLSEIAVVFDENGTKKDYVFEISMTQPLKVEKCRTKENVGRDIPFSNIHHYPEFFQECINDGEIILINSKEEYKQYPKYGTYVFNVGYQTLVLMSGHTDDGISACCIESFRQLTENEYEVHVALSLDKSKPAGDNWYASLITSKFSEESVVRLKVTTYQSLKTSFTEYSLQGTSCKWNLPPLGYDWYGLYHDFTKPIIVNTHQEFEKYIICNDDIYPAIDFSKHSMLLVNFFFPNPGIVEYVLLKNADHHYTFKVWQIDSGMTIGFTRCFSILIPKINGEHFVGVCYYHYLYSIK